MNEYAERLAREVVPCVAPWVRRCVAQRLAEAGVEFGEPLQAQAEVAAAQATTMISVELRAFLELDVDDQRTNPLAVLRAAVRYPTEVLRAAGVPPVRRDEFEVRAFPDDVFRLSPATWSDIDPALQEPGIIWGAWKAKTVLDRRRAEGRR